MNKFQFSFSTESSLIFEVNQNHECPYWAEAHVHFGRYEVVDISIFISDERKLQKVDFIGDLIRDFSYDTCKLFGFTYDKKHEIHLTVFYNHARVCLPPFDLKDFSENINDVEKFINEKLAGIL